jgi:hypothetical protein
MLWAFKQGVWKQENIRINKREQQAITRSFYRLIADSRQGEVNHILYRIC